MCFNNIYVYIYVCGLSLASVIYFVYHQDNDLSPEEHLGNALTTGRLNRSINHINSGKRQWSRQCGIIRELFTVFKQHGL